MCSVYDRSQESRLIYSVLWDQVNAKPETKCISVTIKCSFQKHYQLDAQCNSGIKSEVKRNTIDDNKIKHIFPNPYCFIGSWSWMIGLDLICFLNVFHFNICTNFNFTMNIYLFDNFCIQKVLVIWLKVAGEVAVL